MGKQEISLDELILVCKAVESVLKREYPHKKPPSYVHQLKMGYFSTFNAAFKLAELCRCYPELDLEDYIGKMVRIKQKMNRCPTLTELTSKTDQDVVALSLDDNKRRLAYRGYSKATEDVAAFEEELSETMLTLSAMPPEQGQDAIWRLVMHRHEFSPEVLMTVPTIRQLVRTNTLQLNIDVPRAELTAKVKELTDALQARRSPILHQWQRLVDHWEAAAHA